MTLKALHRSCQWFLGKVVLFHRCKWPSNFYYAHMEGLEAPIIAPYRPAFLIPRTPREPMVCTCAHLHHLLIDYHITTNQQENNQPCCETFIRKHQVDVSHESCSSEWWTKHENTSKWKNFDLESWWSYPRAFFLKSWKSSFANIARSLAKHSCRYWKLELV